jgi:hypothetical protein
MSAESTDVWTILAALDRLSEWAPDIDHSTYLTHQTEGVGTKRRVQIKRTTLIETVTEWEINQALAYTIDGLPTFLPGVSNRWSLRRQPQHRTEVSLTTALTGGSRLVVRALNRQLCKTATMLLDGLAAAVAAGDG